MLQTIVRKPFNFYFKTRSRSTINRCTKIHANKQLLNSLKISLLLILIRRTFNWYDFQSFYRICWFFNNTYCQNFLICIDLDRPVTYLYNTLHYYERNLRDRPGLKRRLVSAVLSSLRAPGWSLSEPYTSYMSDPALAWQPDLQYYIQVLPTSCIL